MVSGNVFRRNIGFVGAVVSMVVIYAASSAPIPVYSMYQALLGISKASLSMTAVTYFGGTVISLLFFGRVSDFIGRRRTIFVTIFTAIVGCLLFMFIDSYVMFLVGRFVQGLACGLASSCVSAYMVDTTPEGSTKLAAIATSGSTMIGLTLGSFGSAALLVVSQSLVQVTYGLIIVLLLVCAVLVYLGSETVDVKGGVVSVIRPHVEMPRRIRPLMVTAFVIFVSSWAVGGFYQAYSSTIALEQFHISNALLGAAIFSSLMAPQILGNALIKYVDNVRAQKLGMVLFSLTMLLILVSFYYNVVVLFLVSSILAAVFIGVSYASTMERILSSIVASERAGILSMIYLISYGGPAVINFVVGRIGNWFSLIEITFGYMLLVVFATLIVLLTADRGVVV